MKASLGGSTEIDVELADEEISRLRNETLIGKITVREMNVPNQIRDLEVKIRNLATGANEFIGLESFPTHADFENITKYVVTLTELGYEWLIRGGAVDREGIAKISVLRDKYPPKPLNTPYKS